MAIKSILIVEDHQAIRSALQEFFKGEGYSVMLACHGQEALDILAKPSTPKPGLILIDSRMPVMDGPTLLLALENNYPKIFSETPIFIMSAGTGQDRANLKATGFLEKPFNLDDLFSIAAKYCH